MIKVFTTELVQKSDFNRKCLGVPFLLLTLVISSCIDNGKHDAPIEVVVNQDKQVEPKVPLVQPAAEVAVKMNTVAKRPSDPAFIVRLEDNLNVLYLNQDGHLKKLFSLTVVKGGTKLYHWEKNEAL